MLEGGMVLLQQAGADGVHVLHRSSDDRALLLNVDIVAGASSEGSAHGAGTLLSLCERWNNIKSSSNYNLRTDIKTRPLKHY